MAELRSYPLKGGDSDRGDWVNCSVCGFPIDTTVTQTAEESPTRYVAVEGPDAQGFTVYEPVVPKGLGCPLCGTGNFYSGKRGDL